MTGANWKDKLPPLPSPNLETIPQTTSFTNHIIFIFHSFCLRDQNISSSKYILLINTHKLVSIYFNFFLLLVWPFGGSSSCHMFLSMNWFFLESEGHQMIFWTILLSLHFLKLTQIILLVFFREISHFIS